MDITEISILHHIGVVLAFVWIFNYFGVYNLLLYFICFIYLYLVNERYTLKLQKRLQFEERKQASQKKLLSDSESVRWLNHAIEKVWPICMQQIASQMFLLPIIPWFLEKYKPWTAREAVVQELYLGKQPPLITEIRVLGDTSDDDHLVLELGMNFRSADDMKTILGVKLRKRLGFGIWARMHVTGMHVEGKVLVGVKFIQQWPFLGRLRLCFVEPPYFQMTVKPIFSHGIDVTEIPGISGWLDKLLSIAFEQTLVQPNMLVVDVKKFVSTSPEDWFTVNEQTPIGYVILEIIEGADMKPSDPNGLADPYVKICLRQQKYRTKIQRKTLSPIWKEEFKIRIYTFDSSNLLDLEVRDKDPFLDDALGECRIEINDLRGGQRHEKWVPLQNVKTGRLHIAITVTESKDEEILVDDTLNNEGNRDPLANETSPRDLSEPVSTDPGERLKDDFEPISLKGHEKIGVWVHHPGSDVPKTWEPRKREYVNCKPQLHLDTFEARDSSMSMTSITNQASSSTGEEDSKGNSEPKRGIVHKIGSIFHSRSPRKQSVDVNEPPKTGSDTDSTVEETTPTTMEEQGDNIESVNESSGSTPVCSKDGESKSSRISDMKDKAKNKIKQSGRSTTNQIKRIISRNKSGKSRENPTPLSPETCNSFKSDCPIVVSDSDKMVTPEMNDISPSVTDVQRKVSFRDNANERQG